jgi:FG-GAP-like repeat
VNQWKVVAAGDFNNDGHIDVMWHNATSGAVGAWLLDGRGNVTGTQTLNWTCSTASGCASQWRVIGAGDFDVDGSLDLLWHNATTGVVGAWVLDGRGNVRQTLNIDWKCGADTGCSQTWKPVAIQSQYIITLR